MARFSLKWLFVAVAVVALATVAVQNGNVFWAAALSFVVYLLLGMALCVSVLSPRRRPFAIGFAAFGLVQCLSLGFSGRPNRYIDHPTVILATYLTGILTSNDADPTQWWGVSWITVEVDVPWVLPLSHLLWVLVLGLLGGFGVALCCKRGNDNV